MDHKRQQIHSGVQEIRQLEEKVNQLRDDKVSHYLVLIDLITMFLGVLPILVEAAREAAGEAKSPSQEGRSGSTHTN